MKYTILGSLLALSFLGVIYSAVRTGDSITSTDNMLLDTNCYRFSDNRTLCMVVPRLNAECAADSLAI